MQRIPWIAAMAAFYNSPGVLSLAQPGRPAFLKDLVLGLPDDPGLGWLGDGVARRFEGHRSVFDRAAGLPKLANLAARLVAGGSGFSGTTPRVHAYRGQHFLPRPRRRSRLLLHLDSPVVTVGGHQEGAAVGYQARDRGKRGDDPGLGREANASCRGDVERRCGDAGTWAGSEELLAGGFLATPCAIGELGVRARAASATVRFGHAGGALGPIRRGRAEDSLPEAGAQRLARCAAESARGDRGIGASSPGRAPRTPWHGGAEADRGDRSGTHLVPPGNLTRIEPGPRTCR